MYEYKILVTEVYDGDTFHGHADLGMHMWAHDQEFRLNRINTPEKRGVEKAQGLVSLDFVDDHIVVGGYVYVRTLKDKKEKYGRWLAEVYPEGFDGYNLNDLIVESGFGKYWDGQGARPV